MSRTRGKETVEDDAPAPIVLPDKRVLYPMFWRDDESAASDAQQENVLSFSARLYRWGSEKGAWTFADFPPNSYEQLGTRRTVPVTGTINGFEFRTSAFPSKKGHHLLAINKAMREGANVGAGETAKFTVRLDRESRARPIPEDLARALANGKEAQRAWDQLTTSMRNHYLRWIDEAKKEDTRASRIRKIVTKIVAHRRD